MCVGGGETPLKVTISYIQFQDWLVKIVESSCALLKVNLINV